MLSEIVAKAWLSVCAHIWQMPNLSHLHIGYLSLHLLICSISTLSTSNALFLYVRALASDSTIVIVLSEVV